MLHNATLFHLYYFYVKILLINKTYPNKIKLKAVYYYIIYKIVSF